MPYLPALDGIRAVAIIAVLIFHVSPRTLSGGFTGVDLFFVLSGFLITSIILHDIREGSFSLREFYVRRIQRLLPNAVACILATIILWNWFMPPGAAVQPAVHGTWTLFNLSNIYIWRHLGGYWGPAAETAPLTHYWSLSIEEQFYILFPASLLLLVRFQPRFAGHWLIAAAVLSYGACLYGTDRMSALTFYLLPTRVWELLIGAALAVGMQTTGRGFNPETKGCERIGWLGLALVAAGYFFIDGPGGFPGWVSLAPTLGALLVLVSLTGGDNRVSRLLSTRFMTATGKVSYSLYLWHWPLIVFGERQAEFLGAPQLLGAAVGGVASIGLAVAAYHGIELPLRQRGGGRRRRLVAIGSGFACTVLFCVFVAGRSRVMDPDHLFDQPSWSADLYNAGPYDSMKFTNASFQDIAIPASPRRPDDSWRSGGILNLYGGDTPRVVVFGSSHALMFSRLIDDVCREMHVSVAFLGMSLDEPAIFEARVGLNFSSLMEAREFDDARRAWLARWRPEVLFVIDRWDERVDTLESFVVKLRGFVDEVSPLVGRVVFTAQIPVLRVPRDFNLRALTIWRMSGGKEIPPVFPDAHEELRQQVASVAKAIATDFPKMQVLRPDLAFYRADGSIRYAEGRQFFYADNEHVTDAGAEQVRGVFQRAIADRAAGVLPQ